MKKRHQCEKLLKKILFKLRLLNLISKIRNKTFFLLKHGYTPRDFWDNWSDTYFHQPCRKEVDQSHYWLLEVVKKIKSESIIEVGCGFGKNLDFLCKNLLYPPKLFGVDISESMVKKAKDYIPDNALLACGDILNLPFSDNSFDLVFTHGTLMHISADKLPKAILEASMSSRGIVLFSGPTGSGKTTSLFSTMDYINNNKPCTICSVEYCISYHLTPKKALILTLRSHSLAKYICIRNAVTITVIDDTMMYVDGYVYVYVR